MHGWHIACMRAPYVYIYTLYIYMYIYIISIDDSLSEHTAMHSKRTQRSRRECYFVIFVQRHSLGCLCTPVALIWVDVCKRLLYFLFRRGQSYMASRGPLSSLKLTRLTSYNFIGSSASADTSYRSPSESDSTCCDTPTSYGHGHRKIPYTRRLRNVALSRRTEACSSSPESERYTTCDCLLTSSASISFWSSRGFPSCPLTTCVPFSDFSFCCVTEAGAISFVPTS